MAEHEMLGASAHGYAGIQAGMGAPWADHYQVLGMAGLTQCWRQQCSEHGMGVWSK